ncbi:MAG: PD-(D/E)XK nuclease family protein, partial [Candidatus Eremiobacterota bacterium]
MSDPFLDQLAELCQTHRTRAKWLLAPSQSVGWTVLERLALEGVAWVNLRLTTLEDLALKMAAPFLLEAGLDPLSEGLSPSLVLRLLLDLEPPGYFRPLAEQPRMADCLWATLQEARMAGYRCDSFPFDRIGLPGKAGELKALWTAYEGYLAEQRLADPADLYRSAIEHLDQCPVGPDDLVLVYPARQFSRLEQRLLENLPGQRVPPRCPRVPGLAPPWPHVEPVDSTAPLAHLLEPGEAQGDLAFFTAGGREAECEEVLRRILSQGLPVDRVEVASSQPELLERMWEKAQRYALPCSVSCGLPAARTRAGRALLGLLRWLEHGWSAGELRMLLLSGDLQGPQGVEPGTAARILLASGAAWGRATYARELSALAVRVMRDADRSIDPEVERSLREETDRVTRVRAWVEQMLDRLPVGSDGTMALEDAVQACIDLLAPMDDGAPLAHALKELRTLGPVRKPVEHVLRLVRDRLERVRVGASRPRPGHLHLTDLAHAGLSGRPHVFLMGLEEGMVFRPPMEDPVLLDEERPEGLLKARDVAHHGQAVILTRLASLGGEQRITLSYSCRDARESRETLPTWLIHRARRLTGLEQHEDPVSVVPSRPADAPGLSGWWLARVRSLGPRARAEVLSGYPWLDRGERAERAREGAAFTEFDGLVPRGGGLNPLRQGLPFSPTSLETLAACPYRWFLQRGLGLTRPEPTEPTLEAWLDPLTRGSLLHDLFAEFLRDLRARSRRPSVAGDAADLLGRLEAQLGTLREQYPPPSETVYEREVEHLEADLLNFLRIEENSPDRTPVGMEVTFGLP